MKVPFHRVLVAAVSLTLVGGSAQAQVSFNPSALAVISVPYASVKMGQAVSQLDGQGFSRASEFSVVLSGVFAVKAIEAGKDSVVWVLERVSDGARFGLVVAGDAVGGASLASGAIVTASAVASGVILTSAGKAIAFIPNAVGRALLHSEQLTR